ncbi:MAG TPA: ATP-binding protein [Polyangiaceae bacterium]|jgi:predicted kinase|nr:ATP-binding protein [Polyangiaceae bacterium]
MTTVHLVCGFLGSGKTTFSKTLTRDTSAVRLSVDEWYLRLFADGAATYEVDAEAFARVLAALNDLWPQVAMAGVDVVLDFGFWNRTLRDEVRERARAIGVATRLYWLRCPDEIACARCLQRNGAPGAFLISAEGFSELKARFETPASTESYEIVETASFRGEH